MVLAIPNIRAAGGLERRLFPGDIMGGGESLKAGGLATAGSGTWTAAAIATGIINRTGPAGAFTDTTDSAANLLFALSGAAQSIDGIAGQTFRLRFINTVAFAHTMAAGSGIVLGSGSSLNTAASTWRDYLFTVLNATPPVTLQANTTNASPVVTFVLPAGMTALKIGPYPDCVNIMPGMGANAAAGITAGTTVAGITMGAGGITGITLSANATSTGVLTLNLTPLFQIDSLGSGTL